MTPCRASCRLAVMRHVTQLLRLIDAPQAPRAAAAVVTMWRMAVTLFCLTVPERPLGAPHTAADTPGASAHNPLEAEVARWRAQGLRREHLLQGALFGCVGAAVALPLASASGSVAADVVAVVCLPVLSNALSARPSLYFVDAFGFGAVLATCAHLGTLVGALVAQRLAW